MLTHKELDDFHSRVWGDSEALLRQARALLNAIICVRCASSDEYGTEDDRNTAISELALLARERVDEVNELIFGKNDAQGDGQ